MCPASEGGTVWNCLASLGVLGKPKTPIIFEPFRDFSRFLWRRPRAASVLPIRACPSLSLFAGSSLNPGDGFGPTWPTLTSSCSPQRWGKGAGGLHARCVNFIAHHEASCSCQTIRRPQLGSVHFGAFSGMGSSSRYIVHARGVVPFVLLEGVGSQILVCLACSHVCRVVASLRISKLAGPWRNPPPPQTLFESLFLVRFVGLPRRRRQKKHRKSSLLPSGLWPQRDGVDSSTDAVGLVSLREWTMPALSCYVLCNGCACTTASMLTIGFVCRPCSYMGRRRKGGCHADFPSMHIEPCQNFPAHLSTGKTMKSASLSPNCGRAGMCLNPPQPRNQPSRPNPRCHLRRSRHGPYRAYV